MNSKNIPIGPTLAISDEMLRVCVHTSLGASGITSLLSAISHYGIGVPIIVPTIEMVQFLVEVCLWFIAIRTKSYSLIFPLQLACAFAGMASVLLVGGDNFLTNSFWIAVIAPIYISVGLRKVGIAFFIGSLALLGGYFLVHKPEEGSAGAIFGLDAFLFTVAMLVFVLILKRWQDKLTAQVEVGRLKIESLQQLKTAYLVHVNHELRNPLTAMVASIDLLHKDIYTESSSSGAERTAENDKRQKHLVHTIKSTSHHVLSILNDVLELERLEAGAKTVMNVPFGVRGLVRNITDIYEGKAQLSGCDLKLRVASGIEEFWVGPESRIRQVLLNLTSNALNHAKGAAVVISAFEDQGNLVFQVADTGPGMSERAMKHLYDPYASSLGATGTSGLGLRICKMIVEDQLNGQIEVQSAPNQGTTFTITLPLAKHKGTTQWEAVDSTLMAMSTGQEIQNPQTTFDEECLSGKRLLLVEDDEDNRLILKMLLEDAGMVVECSETSQQALGLLTSGQHFDVALLDHNLGDKSDQDGVALAPSLLLNGVQKVVGYSGNYSTDLEDRWKIAGVCGIIKKPTSASELLMSLREFTCISPQGAV